ncbi:MAG: site-specific DNA-methyltransferase, partial [Chloroflexi bacterium]
MLNLLSSNKTLVSGVNISLAEINRLDQSAQQHFKGRLLVQTSLTRPLVSFQANKTRPVYRWYKYKEAFSASLVEYFLQKYNISQGKILDPFAGSGTALFVASAMGLNSEGIELLPIGQQLIATKKLIESEFTPADFNDLQRWAALHIWEKSEKLADLPELRITKGAYPEKTKEAIEKYLAACEKENSRVKAVLQFALLCVLESISFTRKDGQYLRWDYRSGRKQGKKIFDKGQILSF